MLWFYYCLSHYANCRCCNKYNFKNEILATQCEERTSRIETTEIVLAKILESYMLL